jgi:hypothetical protein
MDRRTVRPGCLPGRIGTAPRPAALRGPGRSPIEPRQQVPDRRLVPLPAAAGQHAAGVERPGECAEAGAASGADLGDDRREVGGMAPGVAGDGLPERRRALAGAPQRRGPVGVCFSVLQAVARLKLIARRML